jgi:hypothetical protein
MNVTRFFLVSAACCLASICLVSCGAKIEGEAAKPETPSTNAGSKDEVVRVEARANTSPEATVAMKTCSRCNGAGKTACGLRDCKDGLGECPGECLKKTKGVWEHLKVAGHGDDELWQKIYAKDGRHWSAINQSHCGEVVVIGETKVTSGGTCPQCGGSTTVKCSNCGGTGEMVCTACNGKKTLPENRVRSR